MLFFSSLWWIIAQGNTDSWLIGLPAAVAATLVSVNLSSAPLSRINVVGLGYFAVMFLRESVRGGIDVAVRILQPEMQIRPGFRRYRLKLDENRARVLFLNCVSLLPGTLSVDLDGNYLELHLLDMSQDPEPQMRQLEQAISHMFGLKPEAGDA